MHEWSCYYIWNKVWFLITINILFKISVLFWRLNLFYINHPVCIVQSHNIKEKITRLCELEKRLNFKLAVSIWNKFIFKHIGYVYI